MPSKLAGCSNLFRCEYREYGHLAEADRSICASCFYALYLLRNIHTEEALWPWDLFAVSIKQEFVDKTATQVQLRSGLLAKIL